MQSERRMVGEGLRTQRGDRSLPHHSTPTRTPGGGGSLPSPGGGSPGPQARGSPQPQPVGACPAREGRPPSPRMLMRPRLLIPKGQVISPTGGAGRPALCPAPCRLPSGLTNRAWAFRKPAVLDPSQDFAQGQLFVYSAPFSPTPRFLRSHLLPLSGDLLHAGAGQGWGALPV